MTNWLPIFRRMGRTRLEFLTKSDTLGRFWRPSATALSFCSYKIVPKYCHWECIPESKFKYSEIWFCNIFDIFCGHLKTLKTLKTTGFGELELPFRSMCWSYYTMEYHMLFAFWNNRSKWSLALGYIYYFTIYLNYTLILIINEIYVFVSYYKNNQILDKYVIQCGT